MTRFRPRENLVVDATARLLRRSGATAQLREVQFCEKFLDLYARGKGADYVAVEAKVYSPARAFEQASLYALIARKVYVAEMDTGKDSKALRLAEETGIGLILTRITKDGHYIARVAVEAKSSSIYDYRLAKRVWDQARRTYSY